MRYIFLSPHLDDAALSCGGIINALTSSGNKVIILTIFAGDPPVHPFSEFALSLHQRWNLLENPMPSRRMEDMRACAILGANGLHLSLPDCIYRIDSDEQYIVTKEEDLFQQIGANQMDIVLRVIALIQELLTDDDILVSPLAIGNHLDHRIVRQSVANLNHENIYFYADYPYIVKENASIVDQIPVNAVEEQFSITKNDLVSWKKSITAYKSQISTFWQSETRMMEMLDLYAANGGGKSLWQLKT